MLLPIVPQGDFLPTLKSSTMTFDWPRSYGMVEEAEWGEDDAEDNEADKANKDNGDEEGEDKDDSVAGTSN